MHSNAVTTTEPPAIQAIPTDGRAPLKLAFTLKEAATALGVNENTIRRLVHDRKLRKLPLRHIRISAVEMNRFLSEGAR